MAIPQSAIDRFKKFEGNVLHMYLDKPGNVTVGVGNKLPDASTAAALNFFLTSNQQAATDAQKRKEWQTMSAQQAGQLPSFYEQFATMRMKQPEVDALLLARLNRFEADLRDLFPGYAGFPVQAQEGLLDMIYTLGRAGLLGFTNFVSAARNQQWFLAASESRRGGVQPERNDEIRQLFETAGQNSPALDGRWVGAASPSGGLPVQVTVVFTRVGANSFTGQMSGVDPDNGSFFSEPLTNIVLDAARNISFTGPDGEVFRGQANAQFTQMSGTLFDGAQVDGTFSFNKQ